jgi:hypothetical protein
MALDFEDAKKQLAGANTKEALLKLVNEVDIAAEGKVTVLYSGDLDVDGAKVSANDIAEKMAGDPNIRVINKTDAVKLLASARIGWGEKSEPQPIRAEFP